jgi:acyl carrier protein
MNQAELLTELQRAAEKVANFEVPTMNVDTDVQQLGLDSVQLLEMIAVVEENLGRRIPDEALGRFRTVGELCDLLQAGRRQGQDP